MQNDYIFQIKLKSLTIIENGQIEEGEGNNVLSVSLIYPMPQNPSPTSVFAIKLEDKEMLNAVDIPIKNQFIYKGQIIGDSGIEVELTAKEGREKINKFLLKTFGTIVKEAIGLIPGAKIVSLITSGAKSSVESVFSSLQSDGRDEKVHIIGKGFMPINIDTPEGDFVIQLSVPQEVKLTKISTKGGKKTKKTLTLNQGMGNAMVVFDIRKYSISHYGPAVT